MNSSQGFTLSEALTKNDFTIFNPEVFVSLTSNFFIMTNNDILKKLRVALKLKDEDIIQILNLAGFSLSKSEVNALFRSEEHPNYVECGDQILRNFLNGLVVYMRGPAGEERKPFQDKPVVAKEKPKVIIKKRLG